MAYTLNNIASNPKNEAAKRGDSIRVKLDSIKIVDGFNVRIQDDELREHVAGIAGALAAGLPVPHLEVWVNPESGDIELVDGHCRYHAFQMYAAEAKDFDGYVPAVKFDGSAFQRKMRIASSNKQLKLKPVELGRLYISARDEGATRQEIAAEAGMSLAHVDHMIKLAGGAQEVHEAIERGEISATDATKLIRDFGDDAPAELERRMEVAKASGKEKVTAKVAPVKVTQNSKAKHERFVLYAVEAWANSLDDDQRQAIESADDQQSMMLAEVLSCVKELRDCDRALDDHLQEELEV